MRQRGSGRRARLAAAALVAAMLVVCLAGAPVPAVRETSGGANRAASVIVLVGAAALGPEVPRNFLGLSFEATSLEKDLFAPGHPVLRTLLAGLGPGMLRFGGATLDRAAWAPSGTFPGAAAVITPLNLSQMFAFARRAAWTVLLGLDLGHFDPAAAANEAAVAWKVSDGTLTAFEFGNEPDLYASPFTGPLRSPSYGTERFLAEWRAYLRAVRARVPTAPIAGPSVAGVPGGVDMLRQLVEVERTDLQFATSHHYPLGAPITDPSSPAYASIANLLSGSLRTRETTELGGWAQITAEWDLPLRLTETNSVFGGGKHGVSDTLAGALWTADYLFRVASLGIVGVNLHTVLDRCRGYTPICAPSLADAQADRFHVQPNYYALLLFRAAARGRLIPTRVSSSAPVTAYAARDREGVTRVTLINTAPRPVGVRIRMLGPFCASASTAALRGPSLDATGGVTFAGRAVAPDGTWRPGPPSAVYVSLGSINLRLGAASATVATCMPRPGTGP